MATFNNTVSSNPVNDALKNKLNFSVLPGMARSALSALGPASALMQPFLLKKPALGTQTSTPATNQPLASSKPTSPITPPKKGLLANALSATTPVAPATPTQPTVPTPTPVAPQTTQPVVSPVTGSGAGNPNSLFNTLTNEGVDALNQSAALTGRMHTAEQNVAGDPNYSLDTQVGRQGLIQQNIGTQAEALANQGNAYLAGANLQAPQPYSLSSQPYFPGSDTYGGGGTGGAIDRSIQLSNINSAGDFQSKIQGTTALKNTADADISILQDYSKGINGDVPIVQGISQLFGNTVQGNQAVAGFQAKLQTVRSEYQQLYPGADPRSAIPDNITPNQLRTVQQAIASGATNTIAGYQNQLNGLKQGGTAPAANQPATPTTGASSSWPGWNPQ